MESYQTAILPTAEQNTNRMARRCLTVLEVCFAGGAIIFELILDHVRAKYAKRAAVLTAIFGFVSFIIVGSISTYSRLSEGNTCRFDWVVASLVYFSSVLSFVDILQISDIVKLEWFTHVPTTVAGIIFVLTIAEVLYTKASRIVAARLYFTGLPNVSDIQIFGQLMEGRQVRVIARVDRDPQFSEVEWYTSTSAHFHREDATESFKSKFYEEYTIPLQTALGKYIVAKVIPRDRNGAVGRPCYTVSDGVVKADLTLVPTCTGLVVKGDYFDGGVLHATYEYVGGHEGSTYCSWYIHEQKDDDRGSLFPEISGTLDYVIPKHAIGKFISFMCTPRREDGKEGEAVIWIGEGRVPIGLPAVSHVCIRKISSNTYFGEGKYSGGDEGNSTFQWYMKRGDDPMFPLVGQQDRLYKANEYVYGSRLIFSYRPIRNDSKIGAVVESLPTDPIYPELIKIEGLEPLGDAEQNQMLLAVPIQPKTEEQEVVWRKYKSKVNVNWFSSSDGSGKTLLDTGSIYVVKAEDVGRSILCECTITDIWGRESLPARAQTDIVVPIQG